MDIHIETAILNFGVATQKRVRDKPRVTYSFSTLLGNVSFTTTDEENFMSSTLPDDGSATLAFSPKDRKGYPKPLDGPPVWSTSDPTILTAVPISTDLLGTSVTLLPGKPGLAQVRVDFVSNGNPHTLLGDVEVVAGEAVSGDLTFSINKPASNKPASIEPIGSTGGTGPVDAGSTGNTGPADAGSTGNTGPVGAGSTGNTGPVGAGSTGSTGPVGTGPVDAGSTT